MKHRIKRTLKITGITIASFLGFVLLYFAAVFSMSRITVNKNPEYVKNSIPIYILSNGAHVDIVVPIKTNAIDWNKVVSTDDTLGKDSLAEYVAFGWGDKGFYLDIPTWDDLTLPIAFKAVFWLSTSAMHVTYYRDMAEGDLCKRLDISKEQYANLVRYISDSFQKDESGRPILIETDAVYGNNDAFYEAKGRYNLFFTCNTWANNALKACGQKAALWTIFDTGILYHYAAD